MAAIERQDIPRQREGGIFPGNTASRSFHVARDEIDGCADVCPRRGEPYVPAALWGFLADRLKRAFAHSRNRWNTT
jgi:hypothetical protein